MVKESIGWLIFICLCSVLVQNSYAADLEEQRKYFPRAESIAHNPNSSEYIFLKQELADYPLFPYVELKTLIRFPYLSNKKKIESFLKQYENTPLDRPLRKKWLTYLARKQQKALFLHFYRDIGSTELDCHRLQFKIDLASDVVNVLNDIDELWQTGESLPKECNSVLDYWTKEGRRTPEMVWSRVVLAADGGNHTLLPYLQKLLPENQRYLADLWLKVRRAPSFVSRPSLFPGEIMDKETQILSYGLRRLVWHDRDLALNSWYKLQSRFVFSERQKHEIAERFAVSLALSNHKKAGEWLESANQLFDDKEIFRWHLAHLLRQQKWQQVVDIIKAAPPEVASDYSIQYWQARGFEELKAPEQAQLAFQALSNKRHYYGFLASGKLNEAPKLADTPLQYDAQQLSLVAQIPAAVRAREFLELKRFVSARKEWIYLQRQLSDEQSLMAAVIADSWGWHDQAIFTFSRVGYLDDVKRRFPLAYKDQLVNNSEQNKIDPAWAFAIARRESSFMADANSSVGARGLMQLMPGTAKYLAKKRVKSSTLLDPDANAQFGTQYMRYLLDKMDNNQILATASYNAGWRKVKNWLPDEDSSLPADIWVETIPYKETRNYVKAVMAYKQIYLRLLGDEQNLFSELANMRISKNEHML